MGNRMDRRMGNGIDNEMGNGIDNEMDNEMGKRIAADEQPKAGERLLFRGRRLDCEQQYFSEGVFLFGGHWRDEKNENPCAEKEGGKSIAPNLKKEAAIRRIKNEDCLDGWKDVADKLIHLNHNNILRVFGYEEDVANRWRYFALEPYSATLYEYCNGKYRGPIPNESQVLYQITNGICYLHGKGIVHGDLNPLNVVIAAQSRPVRMKISDFGLSKFSYSKQLSEKGEENISFEVKLCLRKYWTLSKKTESLEGIKDATVDIVAAGCILFYYLTRGIHLFGCDSKSILKNLKKNKPVNLPRLYVNHFAYKPIENMISPPGEGFNWLQIANDKFKIALSLQVNTSKLLGSGTYGYVYDGIFNGDRVAVKQMTTTTALKKIIQREMNTHVKLTHVNVVKLLDVADSADNKFTHLVLELCAGTLADFCEKKYSGPELPPNELVLYQIANGLDYIHSRNLVHRDIKPENILISMTTPVRMKVSDLSFVKKTRQDIFSQSKIRGTLQWMAPERLKFLSDPENMPAEFPDGTIKSDTFSCGCVFFYFLTRGTHPFGINQATVPANILLNKPEKVDSYKRNLVADDVSGRIFAGLIGDMIKCKEEERVGLPEVIKQLANLLCENKHNIKCELQRIDLSLDGIYSIRSHPTEPILACASDKELIFYTAEHSSIPFSNWRKKVTCLPQILVGKTVELLEWNFNSTQLAVGTTDGTLVVWSYPDCEILFQRNIFGYFDVERSPIRWNPTVPNLFATFRWVHHQVFVFDSSTGHVITTIDCEDVTDVKWISENRIAVSSFVGKIQIFEMDESNLTTTRLLKELTHGSRCDYLEWNERTQYLASVGDDQINIWSMDHDKLIYNLKFSLDRNWKRSFAWRLCTGNGEEEGGIEMARKSAKNLTFLIASKSKGVFICNLLENEQQLRCLSDDENIRTLAFSPDGRFLAAGNLRSLIIWSVEDWEQIHKLNYWKFDNEILDLSWICTTTPTNFYENKFIVNFCNGHSIILEYAYKERKVSDSAGPN